MAANYKILVFTPIWGRHEVVKIWKAGIDRINAYWPEMFEFIPFCVVSTPEDYELIEGWGIANTYASNKDLGYKHNQGLAATMDIDYDYIVQLGSDDVICNDYLHYAAKAIQDGHDVFGVTDLLFYSLLKDEGKIFHISNGKNKVIGAGRFISREVIEACAYTLWIDNVQKGLDYVSQCKMEAKGYQTQVIRTGGIPVIDFKSGTNIWAYERFKGSPYSSEQLPKLISKKELDAITSAKS